MDLILWRHAEAEEGSNDLARKLTPKGRKQAKKSAAWLQARLPENARVWVSQAARSQQTADRLHRDYQVMAALNPDADARTLSRLLAGLPEDACVVWVGHQPWLGQLCAFLLNRDWHGQTLWSVKKGAFWWFQLRQENGVLCAKLKQVMAPADLSDK